MPKGESHQQKRTKKKKKNIMKSDSLRASGKWGVLLLLFLCFFYLPLSLHLHCFSSEEVLTDKLEVSYH